MARRWRASTSALKLSRHAADLATLAPYLLTLDSPFRIAQEGQDGQRPDRGDCRRSAGPVPASHDPGGHADRRRRTGARDVDARGTARPGAADQRRDRRRRTAVCRAVRRAIGQPVRAAGLAFAATDGGSTSGRRPGREPDRDGRVPARLHPSVPAHGATASWLRAPEARRLDEIATGPEGLFELRRQELARRIGAEAALVRIRQGAAAVTTHAASQTAEAQAAIAEERSRTTTAIALAKTTVLVVGLASAALALAAALYVSGHVTSNLRAISDAMMRLASGDRQSRLPRGADRGDEIGKLFHAFRSFRASVLRLDRSNRQMAQRTALYENMMAGISDGVAILSEQGQIVASNAPAGAGAAGRSGGLLLGRPSLDDVIVAAGWVADARTRAASRTGPARRARMSNGATTRCPGAARSP
jgi:HAMP domain-containing protein